MATLLDTLKKGAEYLQRHEVDEARLNMELLIAHVLKVGRMQLYLDFDRPLTEPQITSLRELTVRRGKGEPLQHLLGTVEFCDLEFLTDSRALVPRPETEELTHYLLSLTWPDRAAILDLGCGSGVIGIALAHHLAVLDQPQRERLRRRDRRHGAERAVRGLLGEADDVVEPRTGVLGVDDDLNHVRC